MVPAPQTASCCDLNHSTAAGKKDPEHLPFRTLCWEVAVEDSGAQMRVQSMWLTRLEHPETS